MTHGVVVPLDVAGVRVGELHDGADVPPAWVPRPFLHPVRTLGGVVLTDRHPRTPLALRPRRRVPGPRRRQLLGWTDVRGRSRLPVAGRPRHRDRRPLRDGRRPGAARHRMARPGGALLLHEDRTLGWRATPDGWQLEWTSTLRAPGARPVALGSPASTVAPVPATAAGSCGSPLHGRRGRTPDGAGEHRVHGSVAPWVAWTGSFADGRAHVLVEALDHRDPWFVRVAQ